MNYLLESLLALHTEDRKAISTVLTAIVAREAYYIGKGFNEFEAKAKATTDIFSPEIK